MRLLFAVYFVCGLRRRDPAQAEVAEATAGDNSVHMERTAAEGEREGRMAAEEEAEEDVRTEEEEEGRAGKGKKD